MIRSKFGERTIDGLNRADFDELNIAGEIDSLTINDNEGSVGQVLSKNPITNKLEFNSVPIADDTITTNMIQDLQITNDKLANTTIQGGKLATDIAVSTTGNISCNDLSTTGNTTLGNAVSDVFTINGVVNCNSTLLIAADGTMNGGGWSCNNFNVASSKFVVNATNTFVNNNIAFDEEVSMNSGGTNTFDLNGHRIVDAGGISLTNTGGTGHDATGDITGVNAITATTANIGTLNLSSALSLSNIDIDNTPNGDISTKSITADAVVLNTIAGITATGGINPTINIGTGIISCGNLACNEIFTANNNILAGSGSLTANGGINTTGSSVMRGISCRAIDTNDNNITMGTGDLTCDTIGSGAITSTTINTQNNNITMGTGDLTCDTIGCGAITSTTINTQNNHITMGTGDLTCDQIGCGAITSTTINTQNNNIDAGSGDLNCLDMTPRHISMTGDITGDPANPPAPPSQLINFNLYNKSNDIPRILACKSFTANHPYTRTINTSYKNIDRDTTTLNCAFDVPPSCKILVEIGFYTGIDLSNERLHLRLVNSTGTEFYTAYINNANHGHTTDRTEVQYASSYGTRSQMVITKLFFSFPTTARGNSVNLQPQLKTNSGTATLYCGGTPPSYPNSTTDSTPPMYVKVESLGSTSSFNWHYELEDGSEYY